MKNPTIIMAISEEGEGSPRLITDPIGEEGVGPSRHFTGSFGVCLGLLPYGSTLLHVVLAQLIALLRVGIEKCECDDGYDYQAAYEGQ